MILGRPLTAEERRSSQRHYNLFSLVNGASYMCLGENVLILFAVHLAAPNAVVALLGSMMYLGYLAMPLGVLRTARVGAAACQADFWVGRNVAALTIALAVFAARLSPPLAWGIVLAGAFLFYGFRAAGFVLSTPLVGDITTEEEAPVLLSRNSGAFYLSGVAMVIAIAVLLHFFESVWALVGVITFGAALGITASAFVRRIDETGDVLAAARQKFLPGLRSAFANADIRRLTAGWFAVNLAALLVGPISALALKRGCGFGDTAALVCAAVQFAACSLVAPLCGRLCRVAGPKAVMRGAFCIYPLVATTWALLPGPEAASPALSRAVPVTMFFLLGVANFCTGNAAPSYFLMVCPDKRAQVPCSISIQLVVSVGAGLAGSVASAGLVRLAGRLAPGLGAFFAGDLGVFKLYFLAVLPLLLLGGLLLGRMRAVLYDYRARHGDDAVAKALRDVQAWRHQLPRRH